MDEIQVFFIAQMMLSSSVPKDVKITDEQAQIMAYNAERLARALLGLSAGRAYVESAKE